MRPSGLPIGLKRCHSRADILCVHAGHDRATPARSRAENLHFRRNETGLAGVKTLEAERQDVGDLGNPVRSGQRID